MKEIKLDKFSIILINFIIVILFSICWLNYMLLIVWIYIEKYLVSYIIYSNINRRI